MCLLHPATCVSVKRVLTRLLPPPSCLLQLAKNNINSQVRTHQSLHLFPQIRFCLCLPLFLCVCLFLFVATSVCYSLSISASLCLHFFTLLCQIFKNLLCSSGLQCKSFSPQVISDSQQSGRLAVQAQKEGPQSASSKGRSTVRQTGSTSGVSHSTTIAMQVQFVTDENAF